MRSTPRQRERALLHAGAADTGWHNLGCWAPGDDYAGAARRLGEVVGAAAGVAPGARVLDLACGVGASLRLWRHDSRAGAVVGVELDGAAVREARAACAADPAIEVRHGDACYIDARDAAGFDAVVCVDAAYHMPLAAFAARAAHALRPGGGLGLSTLLRPETSAVLARVGLAAGARACGVAPGQPSTVAELTAVLAAAGFVDVGVSRLDDEVLGGFGRYVRRVGLRWRDPAARRALATAALIDRLPGLGYAVVRARRGPGR